MAWQSRIRGAPPCTAARSIPTRSGALARRRGGKERQRRFEAASLLLLLLLVLSHQDVVCRAVFRRRRVLLQQSEQLTQDWMGQSTAAHRDDLLAQRCGSGQRVRARASAVFAACAALLVLLQ